MMLDSDLSYSFLNIIVPVHSLAAHRHGWQVLFHKYFIKKQIYI